MKNYSDIEKSIKRWLKRKVKITLGTIVAFLLSCNFISAESLEVTQGDNGEILFNGEIFDEETHQFAGNTFDGKTYTNYSQLEGISFSENLQKEINFVNKNQFLEGIYNLASNLSNIENQGLVKNSLYDETATIINEKNIKNIVNDGVISIEDATDVALIYNFGGKIDNIRNSGFLYSSALGIYNINSYIEKIENSGLYFNAIYSGYVSPTQFPEYPDRFKNSIVKEIENKGEIFKFSDKRSAYAIQLSGSEPSYSFPNVENQKIINKGKIMGITIAEKYPSSAIMINGSSSKFEDLDNSGLLYSSEKNYQRPYTTVSDILNVKNEGVIAKVVLGTGKGKGVEGFKTLTNYGIISADNPIFYPPSAGTFPIHKNLGLYLSEEGHILKHNFVGAPSPEDRNTYEILEKQEEKIIENNKEIDVVISTGGANTPSEIKITAKNESGKTIINAGSDENGLVQSIKSSTIKDLKEDQGYILNGYDKTVVLNSTTGSKNINNSIINGVKNAVTFDGELTLGLNNTVVNGGYGENIILGDSNKNSLNISGESIINGNISLGGENDSLLLDNTVQINGILDGGKGVEDTLAFNSSTTKSEDKNINILYDIKNFEKTNIASDVTLFEKTIDSNGNVKNLSAQLGDITIGENGNLNLRVDGTEKTDGKVIGHALANNVGSITTNGGKLNLKTFGFGEEEVIAFNETDITGLKAEDITVSSYLHEGEINSDNTITVSAKKDLEDIELDNYEKLNAIYHSLIAENLDKFAVEEEQYGAFTKYLHDIYVANPYAYSSELSRKTMGMMRDIADKDLHPDLKEWAIFGGLTHIDGGTEESYYGKGYYSYDIGSRDISADTKITGAYVKGEYGKAEDLTLGVILGGNSSETEIESSKVEGDSFYLGGYAKKYLNNFRFTLGAGIHRGDYEADRVAVGYDGITETRKFSENYGDRGFNLYGNVKYSQELGNGFYFEPSVTLDYSYVDQEGIKESGDLAIDVDSEKFEYTSGIANLDIRKEFVGEKAKHSLIAGVSYERILSGEDEKHITGRFKGGTDFDILVPEKEKDNFALNVKYEVETEKGILFDVKGSYRFENDNNKDQWIVGTGIGYRF